MECMNCGRVLTPLAEILARTQEGTHCPHCWARLRRAAPQLVVAKRKPARRAPALRRAA